MEFEVNNGQKIVLEQLRPGGDVFVAIRGKSEIAPHETYTITPGDFVMMLKMTHLGDQLKFVTSVHISEILLDADVVN